MSDAGSVHESGTNGHMLPPNGVKRKSDQAGLQGGGGPRPNKAVKRRASKACQCCRQRKVRCNVVEQIPCTNCRLDEVECIVSESKRKKKWSKPGDENSQDNSLDSPPYDSFPADASERRGSVGNYAPSTASEHRPHALYNDLNAPAVADSVRPRTYSNGMQPPSTRPNGASMNASPFSGSRHISPPLPSRQLPPYVKPLPARIGADEVVYLAKKGALSIPPLPLRNALLRSFIEFVYPYMPLLEIHDLVESVDRNDGSNQVSLLVFQAIMFSGVAMVDIKHLKAAGYSTRRDARRDFFQKTRLLYDFDYEQDRISLIQALLLMTYWYETPDDQKDSHHWMGIAVSLSHTIGLHRNPERSGMEVKQRRLWRRIWWSTYMRDRLIALGMRRPTRIKNEDFDVPLLSLEDFSISELSRANMSCIPPGCSVMYSADMQRRLAIMCVEKAKLCICISHVLSTQYSVLHNNHGVQSKEGSTRTTMMLVAKKDDPEVCGVKNCDDELRKWKASIAPEVDVSDPAEQTFVPGEESFFLNRTLLHMVYHSTLSALHRPQVLPASTWPSDNTSTELLEMSRANVRHAANQITIYADVLAKYDLIRYLPTVGITVLLPAIIIHLLDIKAPDEQTRRTALQGFCQCMQIMSQLRDIYAAADYSTAFLEAAIRKAEIALPQKAALIKNAAVARPPGDRPPTAVMKANIDPSLMGNSSNNHLTPPPDAAAQAARVQRMTDAEVASRLNSYLADTPPDSNGQSEGEHAEYRHDDTDMFGMADFEPDFDALVNLDAAGEAFALDDADFAANMPGVDTGAGFMSSDVNWMKGLDADLHPTMT
ncbi:fungal-specific transcription factor domain-containing protein [Elsinoe ampelina]|uniref:Fungal-specific transcription factor domain-containing protein n=1 Tax=Elsinoe ampelina TaxID=302913 RepID=A0A6A6GBE5_9PEZI|nr:fungal-specific transcription factor domain-containing protein [Elsinoe ampelina]